VSLQLTLLGSSVPLVLTPAFQSAVRSYSLSVPAGYTSVQALVNGTAHVSVPLVLLNSTAASFSLSDSAGGLYLFHVTILPPAQSIVVQPSGGDPCVGNTMCGIGGQCSAQLMGAANTYALSCQCLTQPIAFFGGTCLFSVVGCPSCVVSSAGLSGSTQLALYGFGLSSVLGLQVGGRDATYSAPYMADTSSAEVQAIMSELGAQGLDAQGLQAISFSAPQMGGSAAITSHARSQSRQLLSSSSSPAVAAYQTLTVLSSASMSEQALAVNYSSLIFYSASNCTAAGTFGDDGRGGCKPCPSGGVWSVHAGRRHSNAVA